MWKLVFKEKGLCVDEGVEMMSVMERVMIVCVACLFLLLLGARGVVGGRYLQEEWEVDKEVGSLEGELGLGGLGGGPGGGFGGPSGGLGGPGDWFGGPGEVD